MASPTLITPSTTTTTTTKPFIPIRSKVTVATATSTTASPLSLLPRRRDFLSLSSLTLFLSPVSSALAATDEEYVKETEDVINKVRTTITLDKNDPNVATAVAELRETSNSWVAKYRRRKPS
ncbi:UNVERIFIED_CONTAM: Photosystem II repair protein PSB27-H1, chloroplastic [Sesamum radiatum]|uniref:Photosystem II repair protein PSB27-H1, chloroplastic n=1 Tax=Sesamum radiatum TaxID=300843 RepID=A0AAW2R3D5_SESRA